MRMTVVNSEAPPDVDQRIVLRGVTWEQYEALLALFGDDPPGIRMAYLEGALEIMSPSRKHETIKKMVARLVELYALERGISLNGLGSTTFRRAAQERGVEPDECYCVGEDKEFPDIAFEVVLTSGGVNRLAIYAGLGVAEVWLWRTGAFEIYRRVYRNVIKPERVAELLILRADMPRSLAASLQEVVSNLARVTDDQTCETVRRAGKLNAELQYARIDEILATGLHAYLTQFLDRVNELGAHISRDFLVPATA